MDTYYNPKRLAQIAFVILVLIGGLTVLLPFLATMFGAAVLCITTWPVYTRLLRAVRGRNVVAASIMTVLLIAIIVLPMVFLADNISNGFDVLMENLKNLKQQGIAPHPPEWLMSIPVVGEYADKAWGRIAQMSQDELRNVIRQLLGPAQRVLAGIASLIGEGVLQLLLLVFIAFFLYRDGNTLAARLRTAAQRLGGEFGDRLLNLSHTTIYAVMMGLVGSAVAQAAVALVGFLIAGVPGALLLTAATFFLAMIPMGPVFIWGGAAYWLNSQGETSWAIFMVLYGIFVISTVDNFVRPILISKGAGQSLLLVALGVVGGAIAFGFIGIFLGPVLIALCQVLIQSWTEDQPATATP
ncbi:MAG TPA: AI-2E family transporter [Burkholderiales bacterium]|nr:AI-2E family transporter [Burkholderiales bacterium]